MKRVLFSFFLVFCTLLLKAQNLNGNYNPYVNGGIISPLPLLPVEANGTGTVSFNIGNTGSDNLDVFPTQYITLTITLSYGVPDNVNPLTAIGGSFAGLFSWSYVSGTYTAIQTSTIPSSSTGTITIAYKVTQNSVLPGSNGFNVNITPAPYHTSSNTQSDDATSSYTYTEVRDFGDAPGTFGSADHILDFINFLGSVVDGEPANQSSISADADDLNGLDDEDGVVFPVLMQGVTSNIAVTVTGVGYLNGWIDWNGDGDYDDTGERIANNVPRFTGAGDISVSVPIGAIVSSPVFARFRFSPSTLSSSSGSASGGEVEDYQITVLCAPPVSNSGPELSSICLGGTSIPLGGSIGGSATGGIWSASSGGTFNPDATTLNSTWTPPAGFSGIATLTLTTTGGTCGTVTSSKTQLVNSAPAPPVVSNSDPVNVCPVGYINLTSLVTSATPSGGTILFKTSNDPFGNNITDPSVVGEGSYYIFYQNIEGCYSTGTKVTITILNCPTDVTPTLIVNPNIMHGVTSFNLIVRISELNLVNTNGAITVVIPKDSRWILTDGYIQALTMLGTSQLNNDVWTYTSDNLNHIFTTTSVIPAGGFSMFGFRITFDPGSTRGVYSITSQIVSGGGGETRVSNNVDSEKIDYFQQ